MPAKLKSQSASRKTEFREALFSSLQGTFEAGITNAATFGETNGITAGIYFYKLSTEKKVWIGRLIKVEERE